MSGILDRVGISYARFLPRTHRQFFALQLARKLNDVPHLRDYLIFAENQPIQILLQAFHRALKRGDGLPAERFGREMGRLTRQEDE